MTTDELRQIEIDLRESLTQYTGKRLAALAVAAGISSNALQEIKNGSTLDIKLSTAARLLDAMKEVKP